MKKLISIIAYSVTLISVVLSDAATQVDECPLPEENYPCYCEEDSGITDMHCNNLNETEQLSRGLKSLTKYKIYQVNLFRSHIKSIKSDAFRGPALSKITFTNSTIFMESPQFLGQESSLKRLEFLSCFDEENTMITWDLEHLQKLRELSFEKNIIRTLKNDWLSSVGLRVISLTLSENGIRKLENKVFQKVTHLAVIFLEDNEIPSISRSMFPKPAENLRNIHLSNNKIEDLPEDIFKEMPSLISIDLTGNLLKTLSESTWAFVIENIVSVHLIGNPFRCDISLKWLTKKRLPVTFKGTCHTPSRLRNRELRSLTRSDFY